MRRAAPAVVFLTLLLLAPLLLLDSGFVARRAAQFLAADGAVQLEGVDGSLLRGLRVQRMGWQGDSVEISAEDVELVPRWRWQCLLRSSVCLEQVAARVLDIRLAPGDGNSDRFPPSAVTLPVGFEIDSLRIDTLVLRQGERVERVSGLGATLRLLDGVLDIDELELRHELAAVRGQLSLGMTGRWPLSAALRAELAPREALHGIPGAWRLWADGDLVAASLRAESAGDAALEFALRTQWRGGSQPLDATLVARGLHELAVLQRLRPWVVTSGPVEVAYRGDGERGSVSLNAALSGYTEQPATLGLRVAMAPGAWRLDSGTLRDAAGRERLAVSGQLGAPGAWAPVLDVRSDSLRLPEDGGLDVRELTVRGNVSLHAADAANSWRVDAIDGSAMADGRALELRGSFRAAPRQALLPLGSAVGSLDGMPWTYRRDAADAAATLRLPRGLQRGNWSLDALELSVAPGSPTRVALRSDGDVETQVQLSLQDSGEGFAWTLAPFEAVVQGVALRSDSVVRGRWLAPQRAVAIDPFCLTVRTTSLCGTEATLGSSGSLQLAVEGEENLSGSLAGDPYALLLGGAGELSLRWIDGAFDVAELSLDLPRVVFDPFVGAGTAEAVRLQSVTLQARATPAEQRAELRAVSVSHGRVDAVLERRGEVLDGTVELRELSLLALTDLLPELDLRAGTLAGELQIGGTLQQPDFGGELRLRDAEAALPGQQLGLRDTQLTITGNQSSFTVDGAANLGGGPLLLAGQCCADGVLALQLDGERNRLRLPAGLDVVASAALAARVDASRAAISGDITVHEGLLEHSGPLGDGVAVSRDIVRVDVEEEGPRRFALDTDVRAVIEPGFTLRSRQLEATLGGDLRVRSRAGEPPQLFGELQVLGGVFRAYGQGLRLDRGSVGFVGDPLNPDINLAAVRDIRSEQIQVGVRATGTLEEPRLDLFSEPPRSERETLSYLLRGRPPDAGAGADSTAMAIALGASAINQSGFLERLNSVPGLSQVSLGADGAEDDTTATISAYVGERLYLSYGMGIYEPVNALTARLYLRSRLWLEVVSRLESSVDLYYRFDRD